jgi:hypothetical protein
MNTYQYQILRFLPDRVSGEFVNLGVVVYDPKNIQLAGRFYPKITRVSSFFPTINSRYLAATLRFFQQEFDKICQRLQTELKFEKIDNIEVITKSILPKDDSSIVFTEPKKLLEVTLDIAIEDLYEKMVLSYVTESEREYVTDKEVWSKVYKSYFDRFEITEHLEHHTVKTEMDSWLFEHAWKNGAWNCFEAVSFDLVKEDSIREKTFKWWGKVADLQSSGEKIHLYLLSKMPSEYPELKKTIKKKLGESNYGKNLTVELISEKEAEKFAKRIKKEIESHESDK